MFRRERRRTPDRTAGEGRVPGVEADLELLYTQVRLLRELAGDPGKAQDQDRLYDFSIRWGALLHGRLPRLIHYDGLGELSPAEQARLAALREEFRDAAPLAERLGLAPTPLELTRSIRSSGNQAVSPRLREQQRPARH